MLPCSVTDVVLKSGCDYPQDGVGINTLVAVLLLPRFGSTSLIERIRDGSEGLKDRKYELAGAER